MTWFFKGGLWETTYMFKKLEKAINDTVKYFLPPESLTVLEMKRINLFPQKRADIWLQAELSDNFKVKRKFTLSQEHTWSDTTETRGKKEVGLDCKHTGG